MLILTVSSDKAPFDSPKATAYQQYDSLCRWDVEPLSVRKPMLFDVSVSMWPVLANGKPAF